MYKMKKTISNKIQFVDTRNCQAYFAFDLPSVIIVRQSKKFMSINATCTVS